MANVSKNELYNLICKYYEEHGNDSPVPWNRGYSVSEWASVLKVEIAPATITALVREGLLAVKEARTFDTGRTVRCYYKPHTLEERDARLAEVERQHKIEWAKCTIEKYEDHQRDAQEIYEKSVADAEQCLKKTLAVLEQWYEEAVALLKENDEVV